MAPRYDEAPEAVQHSYPEVHYPPNAPETVASSDGLTSPDGHYKHDHSHLYAAYPSSPSYSHNVPLSTTSGYGPGTTTMQNEGKKRRLICGCQLVVFVLSVIVAMLSVAVIGFAAGTGIAASKASHAESELAAVSAALANATGPPDPLDFSKIDHGCSKNPLGVTGTTYTTSFFGKKSYTIYCNANAPNVPVMNLFVGTFDDCIDACASWSMFAPQLLSDPASNSNTTCVGVSFIPYWTNRTIAIAGTAPGNCYLKPGPLNRTVLLSPDIGRQAVHAAILAGR
ncbi:hypothetical protein MN608_03231 [Microdochium nivale]|nr:hypothetical protein MN608_03231 [Microdochium nivale]